MAASSKSPRGSATIAGCARPASPKSPRGSGTVAGCARPTSAKSPRGSATVTGYTRPTSAKSPRGSATVTGYSRPTSSKSPRGSTTVAGGARPTSAKSPRGSATVTGYTRPTSSKSQRGSATVDGYAMAASSKSPRGSATVDECSLAPSRMSPLQENVTHLRRATASTTLAEREPSWGNPFSGVENCAAACARASASARAAQRVTAYLEMLATGPLLPPSRIYKEISMGSGVKQQVRENTPREERKCEAYLKLLEEERKLIKLIQDEENEVLPEMNARWQEKAYREFTTVYLDSSSCSMSSDPFDIKSLSSSDYPEADDRSLSWFNEKTSNTPEKSNDKIKGGLPARASNSGVPTRVSNTGVPTRVSNTGVPTRVSNSGVPTRVSNSGVPTRVSYSGVPTRVSYSGVPTRVSYSGIPTRGSNSGVPTRGSNSGVPTRGSNSGVPTRGSNSGVPTRGSNSGVPTRVSNSGVPTRSSNSGIRTRMSNFGLPARVSNSDRPRTAPPSNILTQRKQPHGSNSRIGCRGIKQSSRPQLRTNDSKIMNQFIPIINRTMGSRDLLMRRNTLRSSTTTNIHPSVSKMRNSTNFFKTKPVANKITLGQPQIKTKYLPQTGLPGLKTKKISTRTSGSVQKSSKRTKCTPFSGK